MSYSKFRPRRGTALQWTEANTLLNEGEIAFEFANRIGDGEAKVKIGDGVNRWNDLPYAVNADEIREEIESKSDEILEAIDNKLEAIPQFEIVTAYKQSINPDNSNDNPIFINYPEGFKRTNCMVVGVRYCYYENDYTYQLQYHSDADVITTDGTYFNVMIPGNSFSKYVNVAVMLCKSSKLN